MLDLFGLDTGTVRRWGEPAEAGARPLRSKTTPRHLIHPFIALAGLFRRR